MNEEVKKSLLALKDDTSMGVSTKCDKMLKLLEGAGLFWRQKIAPAHLLVHPANRCGQMINAYDCHQKGFMILGVGCSVEKLSQSLCIEVAKGAAARASQYDANQALVDAAASKLAPVQRSERYLSISSSHVAQFMKAVHVGVCVTEHEELSKVNHGSLSLEALLSTYNDDVFASLVKEGWTWGVISADVEEACEWFPGFAQAVLNTAQQIASKPSEMEQAMSVAYWFAKTKSLETAITYTKEAMPSCAEYVQVIAAWAAKFGGGEDFCMVKLLQKISSLAFAKPKFCCLFICTAQCLLLRLTIWRHCLHRGRLYAGSCGHGLQIQKYNLSFCQNCNAFMPADMPQVAAKPWLCKALGERRL